MTTTTDDPTQSEFPAGDREELEREARIEQAKREEIVYWALNRAAELRRAEHEASLPKREPAPARRSHQGAADMTRQWEAYIEGRIGAVQRSLIKALAVGIANSIKT